MVRTLVCLLALMAPALTAPLTRGERDRAMSELHATRRLFLDSIAGLSEQQWKFKAGPDRWSIAEVAEHITLSEDALFSLVTKKIATMPADPAAKSEISDEDVLKRIADRSRPAQAPEFLRPTNEWPTREALAEHFKGSRDRIIGYVETTEDDLRSRTVKHPVGLIDGYQWVLLISAHTQRHVDQIKEVKQQAGYPK